MKSPRHSNLSFHVMYVVFTALRFAVLVKDSLVNPPIIYSLLGVSPGPPAEAPQTSSALTATEPPKNLNMYCDP